MIKSCIKSPCQKFILYTNWIVLIPILLGAELLDEHTTELLLKQSTTAQEKGLEFYLRVLPSKGSTAYSRFYDCIAQEKEHSGHKSLLELMESS